MDHSSRNYDRTTTSFKAGENQFSYHNSVAVPILVRNHFLLRGVGLRHGEDLSFPQFVIFIHMLHEKLYESPSIRLQNDNAPKKVVWGRPWYVSTNAMLYYISHYYEEHTII